VDARQPRAAHRHHDARRPPVALRHAHAHARHAGDRAALRAHAADLFSLECWGGATFDVALRFLKEDPWERLATACAKRMPNMLFQMLLRASNAVGYTNYADNVVRYFVQQAAKEGVDVFRVFDSLNWVDNMRVAMDAVIETGALCEGGHLLHRRPVRPEARPSTT
jgi:pyruvate carboxylase